MSVFDRSLQCKEELEQNSRVYWVWDDCFCTDTQPASIGLRVIFVTSCKQVRRCVAPFASWPSTLHLFLLPFQLPLERHRMEIRHVYVVWIPSSYQSGHWPDSFHQSFLVSVSSTQWKCVKSEARSMDHPITVPSCWKSTVLCDVCSCSYPIHVGYSWCPTLEEPRRNIRKKVTDTVAVDWTSHGLECGRSTCRQGTHIVVLTSVDWLAISLLLGILCKIHEYSTP